MSVGINFPFSLPVFSDKVCSFIWLFSNLIWIYSLAFPSEIPFFTYPLFWIVEIVGAYVEGLPIPNSSSFLTSEASEYLYGGLLNFWLTIIV